jgi:putative transposase
MISPAQRRSTVCRVQQKLDLSQRRVCRVIGQPRSTQRYCWQQRNGERVFCERMRELALRHPRYGYRRIAVLLRDEGWCCNVKRVHRLWRQEGLKVQKKQAKRTRLISGDSANACYRKRPERINDVWSFDFCFDRTADGRPLKVFSVLDEYTRRCLLVEVQRRITGADDPRCVDEALRRAGSPALR